MVKCDVIFEVRTEFLNNIYTSFGFKGLKNPTVWKRCVQAKFTVMSRQFPASLLDLSAANSSCGSWISNG
jgi:hypothetical protein